MIQEEMFLFQSLAHLIAMARLMKQEKVLKQRISEATGTPISDINAQDSRWLYIRTLYFQHYCSECMLLVKIVLPQ